MKTFTKYPFGKSDNIIKLLANEFDEINIKIKNTRTFVNVIVEDDVEIYITIPDYLDVGSELFITFINDTQDSIITLSDGFNNYILQSNLDSVLNVSFVYDGINFNSFSPVGRSSDILLGSEIKSDTITPTDLQITTGDKKTLELMTPVYADIDFPIIVRSTGVGRPEPTVFNGRLQMPEWEVNDFNVCESQELIHEWKEGSTVSWHIHLTTNGTNVDDRYVKFELEYAYSEDGLWIFPDVFITPDILIPANTPSRKQHIISITTFTSAGSKIGDHVLAYLKRIPADGTAPTGNPWIPMLQLHVLKDTLGSRNIGTK